MRLRILLTLGVAGLWTAAGCRSGAPAQPRPAPSAGLAAEWQASEQVLQQAREEQARAERDLARLQQTIYQTAVSLKQMKDQAERWDRALVTNRAALLMLEDRLLDLRQRAQSASTATPVRAASDRASGPKRPAAAAETGTVFRLVAEGNQALRAGDLATAQQRFTTALERDPNLVSAQLGLAFCAYQMDAVDEARRRVRAVLGNQPSQPQAISLRGLLNLQEGKLSAALADTARAVELDPGDAQLRKFHGIVLQAGNRTEQALAEMREAARLNPQDGETLLNLAILLARRDPPEPAEARRYYQQALAAGQPREPKLDELLERLKERP